MRGGGRKENIERKGIRRMGRERERKKDFRKIQLNKKKNHG